MTNDSKQGWLKRLVSKLSKISKKSRRPTKYHRRDKHTASLNSEHSQVEAQIRDYLDEFRNLRVSDVMLPRSDIVAAPVTIGLDDLYKKFIDNSLTRIPVYQNNPDEIIGFVHVKDFLPYLNPGKTESDPSSSCHMVVKDILRKIIYAPRSTKCIDLLTKMRQETTHIAVILDEYGGTEGLVIIEMLIEKIIGDIRDEHDGDRPELVQIHKISPKSYMIDAKTSIDKVRSQIIDAHGAGSDWLHNADGEYETIGGFILSYLGRMPYKGEVISNGHGLEIEILEVEPRRVKMVKLTFDCQSREDL